MLNLVDVCCVWRLDSQQWFEYKPKLDIYFCSDLNRDCNLVFQVENQFLSLNFSSSVPLSRWFIVNRCVLRSMEHLPYFKCSVDFTLYQIAGILIRIFNQSSLNEISFLFQRCICSIFTVQFFLKTFWSNKERMKYFSFALQQVIHLFSSCIKVCSAYATLTYNKIMTEEVLET